MGLYQLLDLNFCVFHRAALGRKRTMNSFTTYLLIKWIK